MKHPMDWVTVRVETQTLTSDADAGERAAAGQIKADAGESAAAGEEADAGESAAAGEEADAGE